MPVTMLLTRLFEFSPLGGRRRPRGTAPLTRPFNHPPRPARGAHPVRIFQKGDERSPGGPPLQARALTPLFC